MKICEKKKTNFIKFNNLFEKMANISDGKQE